MGANMLAINRERGFVPTHLTGCWRADIEVLRTSLA